MCNHLFFGSFCLHVGVFWAFQPFVLSFPLHIGGKCPSPYSSPHPTTVSRFSAWAMLYRFLFSTCSRLCTHLFHTSHSYEHTVTKSVKILKCTTLQRCISFSCYVAVSLHRFPLQACWYLEKRESLDKHWRHSVWPRCMCVWSGFIVHGMQLTLDFLGK